MGEETKKLHTHRVGTLTLGSSLILGGILFLAHIFVPIVTYRWIFHAWPCILILLGIEILLANRRENQEFVYDKGAVCLMILLTFFSMVMAAADWVMEMELHVV
ncbi:MAG: hypothetical protein IJ567_06960 [Lachnospiraceae bacterium]|nr:hypothetical protein [Lachnospiraceae bacterium]